LRPTPWLGFELGLKTRVKLIFKLARNRPNQTFSPREQIGHETTPDYG
jgi:hypothetical protein